MSDYKKWPIGARHERKVDGYLPPTAPMDDITTNRIDYTQKPIAAQRSFKPDNVANMSMDPFADSTTHRDDYIRHPLAAREMKEKPVYKANKQPFDPLTTFRRDYTGMWAPKLDSFKPSHSAMQSDKPLDDMTESRDKYIQWNVRPPQGRGPQEWVKPQGTHDFRTTHHTAFVEHNMPSRTSFKPDNSSRKLDVPFEGRTNYTQDFVRWPTSHKIRGDPSRKDYQEPKEPFGGMATYRAHYIPQPIGPQKSYKPESYYQEGGQFEGNTLYRIDFTAKNTGPCPVVELPKHGYTFAEVNPRGHRVYQKANGVPVDA